MKILMVGAGVLGTLYAARLQKAGQQVVMLARGERLKQLQERGIELIEAVDGLKQTIPIEVTDQLQAQDEFDLAIVLVRKNQLASVLPLLEINQKIPAFLFMVNNAAGPQVLIDTVGKERVLLGFPGAGGKRDENGVVTAHVVSQSSQPTTLGELNGRKSQRLMQIAAVLEQAGFPVKLSTNMDAWLKTHVALVSPIANAIYLAGGKASSLANTRDGLILMIRAIREGLHVLNHLDIPITPGKYHLLMWIPEDILIAVLQKGFKTERAELLMAQHACAARDEMYQLAIEFQQLALQAYVPTPNIDNLIHYIDPHAEPLAQGSRNMATNRRDWLPFALFMAALSGTLFRYYWRKSKPHAAYTPKEKISKTRNARDLSGGRAKKSILRRKCC